MDEEEAASGRNARPEPVDEEARLAQEAADTADLHGGHFAAAADLADDDPIYAYANSLLWRDLCKAFEAVVAAKSSDAKNKKKNLARMIFPDELLAVARNQHQSLFPYARLVMPVADSRRGQFGLKEKKLEDLFLEVWGKKDRASAVAKELSDYKAPKVFHGRAIARPSVMGDFSSVVCDVATRNKFYGDKQWTIRDVNRWLDELIDAEAAEDKHLAKLPVFRRILQLPAVEQKWLVRVILRDLQIGLSHESLLERYHRDAKDVYNSNRSLKDLFVKQELWNPDRRLRGTISLHRGFGPMRADKYRMEGDKTLVKFTNGFFMERKLDGDRMMLHMSLDKFAFYGRHNTEHDEFNVLEPYIREAVGCQVPSRGSSSSSSSRPRCTELILDGEMMTWDEDLWQYLDFGSNQTAAGAMARDPNSRVHLCYVVFDVVWCSGWVPPPGSPLHATPPVGDITAWTLEKRKAVLSALLQNRPDGDPKSHFVRALRDVECELVGPGPNAAKVKSLMTRFGYAIDHYWEGLIVKRADSPYVTSKVQDWLKVKPEYAEGAFQTLDCVIVGGQYSQKPGKGRGGKLVTFTVAVRNDANDSETDPAKKGPRIWIPLCNVGTGFSHEDFEALDKALAGRLVPSRRLASGNIDYASVPSYLGGWKPSSNECPDMWVRDMEGDSPSVLIALKGSELVAPARSGGGVQEVTVRFPRCEHVHWDKPVAEAATLSDVREMRKTGMVNRTTDGQYKEAGRRKGGPARKDGAGAAGAKRAREGAGQLIAFQAGVDTSAVEREGSAFAGCKVWVMPQDFAAALGEQEAGGVREELHSRDALARAVVGNGGEATNVFRPDTTHIVGCRMDPQARLYATGEDRKKRSIMTARWVQDCVDAGNAVAPHPRHFLSANAADTEQLRRIVDAFGDLHAEPVASEEAMRVLLARVPAPPQGAAAAATLGDLLEAEEDEELRRELCGLLQHSYSVFRGPDCVPTCAFFLEEGAAGGAAAAAALRARRAQFCLYGGTQCPEVSDPRVNLVVVREDADAQRAAALLAAAERPDVPVVLERWVAASVAAGSQLPLEQFVVAPAGAGGAGAAAAQATA